MPVPVGESALWATSIGSGPPVLCLHGGLGLDHSYFRPWLDPLAEGARVVYYDHRGNGRSPEPQDWSRVDHDVWVSDIEELRRHLDLERVFLFGHSYGGYFAQQYALDYPDRVLGLILCDTSPAADYGHEVFEKVSQRGTPEQVRLLATGFTRPFEGDASE